MSSHEPFTYQSVDVLIASALNDLVKDVQPSPRLWERIRQRVRVRSCGQGRLRLLAPVERFFISAGSGLVWEQFVRIGPADDQRRQLRSAFI